MTADLEDGADFRVAGEGADGVGGNLVFDSIGLQHGADQAAGGAGGADGLDVNVIWELVFEFDQEALGCVDGITFGEEVSLGERMTGLI